MSTHKDHLATSETLTDSPKFSRSGFITAIVAAGFIILASGWVSWSNDLVAGILICFGAFAKTISLIIGAAARDTKFKRIKPEIDERLGYLDALAAITAFPALFAVGAELFLQAQG